MEQKYSIYQWTERIQGIQISVEKNKMSYGPLGATDGLNGSAKSTENGEAGKYEEISSYGLIGNMITSAHISQQGSIDWFCYPYFDSPSIFGSILDHDKGGHFKICANAAKSVQSYWPGLQIF